MATAEFSKFAGIWSAALSQHHLSGFENSSTGTPSPPLALFIVVLSNAHLTSLSKMSMKRREVRSKGEKERYKHLNAEFQRIARRDKVFFSDQCKEIEENNRMGKTRHLFKKIRDTRGTFHAKMGTIKDRNGMDLEAEDIKKR